MPRVDVQNVTVTETAGNDLTAVFSLQTLSEIQIQGLAAYKHVDITPSWRRLIPDLDDLDEIILPEEVNETILIEFPLVNCG